VVFSVASELAALAKLVRAVSAPLDAERAEWAAVASALTLGLRGKSFVLGEHFTIADAMVGGSLWLAQFLGVLAPYPELLRYYERVSSRPAFARAFADAVPA
jgi:glutathione S-transferase